MRAVVVNLSQSDPEQMTRCPDFNLNRILLLR